MYEEVYLFLSIVKKMSTKYRCGKLDVACPCRESMVSFVYPYSALWITI